MGSRYTKELAKRLRMARAALGITQAQAAEMAEISQSALSLYEKAKREPHASSIVGLAQIYGVSTDWLFGLTDNMDSR